MGADIKVLNNNGTNLLMCAKNCFVNTGDSSVFEYLVDKGLTISQEDYYGKNLCDYCKEEKIIMIEKYDLTLEKVGDSELIKFTAKTIKYNSLFLLEHNTFCVA